MTRCSDPFSNISFPRSSSSVLTQHLFSVLMAPKRRSSKKGESRMDAALDAMHPYGFDKQRVRRTVRSLLEVYGGNDGWVFIEESSYTLLVETLLKASPQVGLIEANPGDGSSEVTPASEVTAVGCSNNALQACCKAQTSDDTPLTNNVMGTGTVTSETGSQLPIKSVDTVSSASGIGSVHSFKSVDTSSVNRRSSNELLIKAASETPIKAVTISAEKKSECQPAGNLALRENHGPRIPQLNHKRRRPCYGWISSDEENEDLIEVIPKSPL
ncbi:uncharacterized protein LOC114189914 isoform X2 [Vigna unguiculata]|uniref:uncharacterized protein LOC114189914 isoform X2 n=1 Tax=Vigna unguiculata TaxID=3917 RepID=UPI0010166CF5|nr:uncharacterized protein LOC114189914 isoform X2 [Vigna unguiculata]